MGFDLDYWRRGSRIMIAATVGGVAANYAFNMALARVLAPHDYGDIKVALAFMNLSALVVLLGGERAAGRYFPTWLREGGGLGIWEYVRTYLIVALVLSLILILGTVAASLLHLGPVDMAKHHPLVFGALVVPLLAVSSMIARVFQCARQIAVASLPWRVAYPLLKMVLVLAAAATIGKITDIGAIWMVMLATILVVLYQVFEVMRRGLMPLRRAPNLASPRAWLFTSVPMMLVMLLQGGIAQMDILMLEMIGGEGEVGHFGAAASIVQLETMAQHIVIGLVLPLIQPALSEGKAQMRELQERGFRLLAILAVPPALCLFIFGWQILALFGPSYTAAHSALLILLAGRLVSTLLILSTIWLQYSDNERVIVKTMFVALTVNAAMNLVLIPWLGMTGAATATALTLIGTSSVLSFIMRRRLSLNPWPIGALVRFQQADRV